VLKKEKEKVKKGVQETCFNIYSWFCNDCVIVEVKLLPTIQVKNTGALLFQVKFK